MKASRQRKLTSGVPRSIHQRTEHREHRRHPLHLVDDHEPGERGKGPPWIGQLRGIRGNLSVEAGYIGIDREPPGEGALAHLTGPAERHHGENAEEGPELLERKCAFNHGSGVHHEISESDSELSWGKD